MKNTEQSTTSPLAYCPHLHLCLAKADVQDGVTEKAVQTAHRKTRTADGIRITEFGGLLGNIEVKILTFHLLKNFRNLQD